MFEAFSQACAETDYRSFEHFCQQIHRVFERYDDLMAGVSSEVMIVGWGEASQNWVILPRVSDSPEDTRLKPKAVYPFTSGRVLLGVSGDGWTAESFEVDRHAVDLFEQARQHLNDLRCGQGERLMGCAVGGALLHMEVTPHAIAGGIVKTWPDVVGRPLNRPLA